MGSAIWNGSPKLPCANDQAPTIGWLLMLSRVHTAFVNFDNEGEPEPMIAKSSQETLAQMIGTTVRT